MWARHCCHEQQSPNSNLRHWCCTSAAPARPSARETQHLHTRVFTGTVEQVVLNPSTASDRNVQNNLEHCSCHTPCAVAWPACPYAPPPRSPWPILQPRVCLLMGSCCCCCCVPHTDNPFLSPQPRPHASPSPCRSELPSTPPTHSFKKHLPTTTNTPQEGCGHPRAAAQASQHGRCTTTHTAPCAATGLLIDPYHTPSSPSHRLQQW